VTLTASSSATTGATHFHDIMEPVANRLLGERNAQRSKAKNGRWGTYGSLSVDFESGRFYDHENKVGGGVLDLIGYKLGCDQGGALDWLRAEGFLPPREKQTERSRVVRAYDYTDESGALIHQTVRLEPKSFRQRRPHPEKPGEWIWNLAGVQLVLYRLPEVISGVATGRRRIFICEGEKDADNVAALDFVATTCAMGAGKWCAQYNETLRDAHVVLLPHNDDPGRAHAEQIAAALSGIAKSIRVLDIAEHWSDCPPKGDISDWIAAGGTADQIRQLVKALPEWEPPAGPSAAEDKASVAADTWPQMDEAAYYGLAGDVVRAIAPDSESDPVAILVQYLAAFGNVVGNTPYYLVENSRHTANLFVALTGNSAKGRKGTAGSRVRAVARRADETWFMERTAGGLSSGEGLIYAVRNPVSKWNAKEKVEEVVDPGVTDKRLMLTEPEFASALSVMERHGNTLSPVIRNAWDGERLQTLTRNSPLKADGAHISIVAHITETELRARLTRTDMANGFANRFQFFCVRRSKLLAHGGSLDEAKLAELAERTRRAVEHGRSVGRVTMTEEAAGAWSAAYADLSADRPGLLGAVVARAEAQVIRLALIYALLDCALQIDVPHLEAAMAVWAYSDESAQRIFGDSLGDPTADEILTALRRTGAMTRTEISNLFARHRTADQIGIALGLLLKTGRAKFETRQTGGRPVETWSAI
jgi:hypothetical protein